jgi:Flp pilus assembly protein TadG
MSIVGSSTTSSDHADCGQATPLAILVVVLALVAALGVSRLGAVVVDRASARAVADAAALAAVHGGSEAASDVVARSGAEVLAVEHVGDGVVVTVQVGDVTASSRAAPR